MKEGVGVCRVIERVAGFIERHRMFDPGMCTGVAVSGGADSVCLLDILAALAPRWNLGLRVLHLDHGLRGEESREDARFVARLAGSYGFPFESREADVGAVASRQGGNLEQAAREARRGFFLELLSGGALDRVALGHTMSDQAETVLFRMLRGAGPPGLAAMAPVRAEGLVRPLLCVTRAEVEEYLCSRGISWREDSSNRDPRFARNRIRHQLLPELSAAWNSALTETLARTAAVLQEEESWWDAEVDRLAGEHFTGTPPEVILAAARTAGLHRAVARRLVRRAIQTVKGDLCSIDFAHVEQVLEMTLRQAGDGRMLMPGVDVMRSFDWIRFAPPAAGGTASRNYSIVVPVPGRAVLPGGGEIRIERAADGAARYNKNICLLSLESLPAHFELRNWRPGDAYRPAGHAGTVKLKTLFQQARIPLWERRGWPLLLSGDRIVWSRRFGAVAESATESVGGQAVTVSDLADISKTWNPDPCM